VPDRSFEEFVRTSLPALGRYAFALTGGVQAGEDLVQDTLVKVARAWRRVRADGQPMAYARVVMLRTYVSNWRYAMRRPRTVPLVDDRAGPDPYAAADVRDQVRRALTGLSRDQRAVLVLGYLDGLPDEEIAGVLGRRPATVRSLRHRALAALRQQLAGEAVGGAHGHR
jgi:RNA polymerase sigma-70 factor (sigma-E family)